MKIRREALFLDTPGGQRFAVVTWPQTEPKGGLVYVHPFAEEMNKSRRMAAIAAQAFAEDGWLVFQGDLKGCGDSAGDFGEATWQDWIADLSAYWDWLEEHCSGVHILWALRAGCLIATDWLAQTKATHPLLLWQPILSGDRYLTQFLRLKAMNTALRDEDGGGVKSLLESLQRGTAIEIAGYVLNPELAAGLGKVKLRLDDDFRSPIALIEVSASERTRAAPASAAFSAASRERTSVFDRVVEGPSFWHTVEVETAPALTSASLDAIRQL